MKKLLLLLTLLLSINSFAQIDSLATDVVEEQGLVIESTAERIIDKYSGKAYDAVKELAAALQVPAEHVYKILVKQAVVNSISYLIIYICILGMIFFGTRLILKESNTDREYNEAPIYGILGGILAAFGVLGFIFILATATEMVGGFVNPEYYAIQEILETFKK